MIDTCIITNIKWSIQVNIVKKEVKEERMEKEIYTAVLADCEVTFEEVPEILRAFLDSNSEWLEVVDIDTDTDEVILLNKNKVIYLSKQVKNKER